MTIIIIIAVLIAVCIGVLIWLMPVYRHGDLTLITGGVKIGKTHVAVAMVKKDYRIALLKWRFKCLKSYIACEPLPEKPLIYSNMPIGKFGEKYTPLTMDLITGKERFRYGSIVYYNEASLIAGSKDIKDEELNDHLLQFFKLIAHRTKGKMILDTQSPQDIHYTIKRSLSTYLYIEKAVKLPFVSLLWIREMRLVDGDHSVDLIVVNEESSKSKMIILSHKYWKMYDRYAYSSFTDDLPVNEDEKVVESQKMVSLLRCRDIKKGIRKIKNEKSN